MTTELTILGQPLSKIRQRYGYHLYGGQVLLATHEAAHAIVALSLGHRVTELAVHIDYRSHVVDGYCSWDVPGDDVALMGTPHEGIVTSAGLTGVLLLHESFNARQSELFGTDTKDHRILSGLTDKQCDWAHRCSRTILDYRLEQFDRLAAALVRQSVLSESEIREVTGHVEIIAAYRAAPRRPTAAHSPSTARPAATRSGASSRNAIPGLRYSDAVIVRGTNHEGVPPRERGR
jgi:hypothetical protein